MNIPIPLDSHNFLRRECPSCEKQFKWYSGSYGEEAETSQIDPLTYFCPLCGVPAANDQWWTKEQLKYARDRAMPSILEQLSAETGFRLEPSTSIPDAMTEPDDMVIVKSPCHELEPIKIPLDYTAILYCLICGSYFSV